LKKLLLTSFEKKLFCVFRVTHYNDGLDNCPGTNWAK